VEIFIDKNCGHFEFLFFESEIGDGEREIFDGEYFSAAFGRGDSDGIEFGVKKIFAVGRRIHPLRVNTEYVGTFCNIFSERTEARAGAKCAGFEVFFAGQLMRERILLRHALSVLASACGERIIPTQRMQSLSGAFAICGVE
jgi:hypothetical protein